jgi:hypothetical protein
MVTVAIGALELEYLVKVLDWGRSWSRYIFSSTPTPNKIPTDSDCDWTALDAVGHWDRKVARSDREM